MTARCLTESTPGRSRRGLLLVATLVACACPAAAEPDAALGALMQALAARSHGHALFTEHQYLAILDHPLETSGELDYEAPDRLEKRTLRPRPESVVLDHGVLSIRRGSHRLELSLGDYPQLAPMLDSIRAALAGDLATLERGYALEFITADGGWSLLLVPRATAVLRLIARIRLRGSGALITEFSVERADGDRSVMTISAVPEG